MDVLIVLVGTMHYIRCGTECICVVMLVGAHGAISLVGQCQISVVDDLYITGFFQL